MSFCAPERYMVSHPALGMGKENNGFFQIPFEGKTLSVMSSDGGGWEHVSVSTRNKTPTWAQMVYIKNLFWSPDDCVVQYHPPKSEYVNNHEHCLHLWRPIGKSFPMPPAIMVGVK